MSAEAADKRTRLDLSLATFGAAIGLCILGDVFLYPTPWGVGVPIFFLIVALVCGLLMRKLEVKLDPSVKWIAPAVLLFSATFAWRDADALRFLNGLAIVLLIGLAALRRREGRLRIANILDYPFRLVGVWFQFVADAFSLMNLEGMWPALKNRKGGHGVAATARGVIIAVPLLLVFGGLFASADASFERLLSNTFRIDGESFFYHSLTLGTLFLFVGGFLRRMFLVVDPPPVQGPPAQPATQVGITEIGIVLGSLNLLFAAFVATQFSRLFGGAEVVRATPGLDVADYARRGFFELATVAFLTLTLLLGTHALLKREGKAETIYRTMAAGLVILVFVVMQSAVMRMNLYVESFGTTQLRFYVLAAIAWIATVFLWFAVTSLRGRHDRFAFGGLVLFLLGIFGLNVANPDAVVARTNLSRTANLDAAYLTGLSADAVPEIVKALPRLSGEAQSTLKQGISDDRPDWLDDDARAWNFGRASALAALKGLALPPVSEPSTISDENYGRY
ncbi:MAG: DUF4153 domain-containing protein [Fimbriimonas sp.]